MTWSSKVISLSLQEEKSNVIGWNELGIEENQSGLFKLGSEDLLYHYRELARQPALKNGPSLPKRSRFPKWLL